MIQLMEMLMKALSMFGIKADLSMLDLPSLLMKAGNIDSLKNELMSQFGEKLGLGGDVAKKVMGGIDLPSLDLDAIKNTDLSKLDVGSMLGGLAGGAGMAGLAGSVLGGLGDKAEGGLGGMLGGLGDMASKAQGGLGGMMGGLGDMAKSATDTVSDVASNTTEAASNTMEAGTEAMGDAAGDAASMASNTAGAAKEGMGDMIGNAMHGMEEAQKFAQNNQGIIAKIMSFLGLK